MIAGAELLPVIPPTSTNPANETDEVQPFVMTADMMNQLMRENPNNMTHALRTWMTRSNEKAK